MITFPKRKLNLTITILTILCNDIFTIYPIILSSFHRKSTIYIYISIKQITSQILHRSNIIPLYFEFHSIPRENITPITQNPIKQIITNSIEHRSKIPFYKIQISHLEFQPYTFKTLAKRHPVAKAGRKQRPILFHPASKYFYFFFFETRLALSPPSPLSPSFPDTTEHRLSRRIRDRFNIGLGDTWFNKA